MGASPVSGATTVRPLRVMLRPDLVCVPQVHGGDVVWIVKDPVALKFTALGSEEFALLQLLDGRRSPLDVCREFERRFLPRRLKLSHLAEFVTRVHALGLVLADAPEQGERLLERRQSRKRWARAVAPLSILAIRFRGWDADQLLGRLERVTRWAFQPGCALAWIGLMVFAAISVVSQRGAIGAAMPGWESLLSGENLLWVMLAVGIAKILHELGHGVACKHFGGECHEMGVMLLVFVPCLYCNVSDAWLLPDKWKRIVISGAGILVELTLAAVCAIVWRFSEPGPVQQLALFLLVLCSVNTLLLNGNPLMRYDGYYILSDLWGIPNLAQQSQAAVRGMVLRALGLPTPQDDVRADRRRRLAAYGVMSGVYRLLVLAGILWVVHRTLAPQGLGVVSVLLAAIVIAGLLAAPVIRTVQWIRRPALERPIDRRRLLPAVVVAGLAAAVLCMAPVPQHARAPLVVEPADATPVYAVTSGRLGEAVRCGSRVEAGDVLVRLENIDLEVQLAELNGRRARLEARIAAMEARRDRDPSAARSLPTERQSLQALERQLQLLEESRARLTLIAPRGGIVIPSPAVESDPTATEPPPLSPIEPDQQGRFIPAGTLMCLVGETERVQVVLLVDDNAIDLVQPGQSVTLQMDAIPWQRPRGVVRGVSRQEMAPQQENAASWVRLAAADAAGETTDARRVDFEARVELDKHDPRLRIGGRGSALVTVRSEPLGMRAYRALRRLFGLRL